MKKFKSLMLLLLLGVFPLFTFSQSLTDVARSAGMTWYGIDFSVAKFIGFSNAEISSKVPADWGFICNGENSAAQLQPGMPGMPMPQSGNNNIASKIRSAYGKKIIYCETEKTKSRNDTIDCKSRISDKSYSVGIEQIESVVKEHQISGSGYGLLMIVESVEKASNCIYIWAVYINNQTGQIISTRRYSGCGWAKDNRRGDYCSLKGIKLVIKLSGMDLKKYKK